MLEEQFHHRLCGDSLCIRHAEVIMILEDVT